MKVIFATLVFVPFIGWHVYSAICGMRTDVSESLTASADRTHQPAIFGLRVTHHMLFSVGLAGAFVSVVLELAAATLVWAFAGYMVAYITMVLATVLRIRQRAAQLKR